MKSVTKSGISIIGEYAFRHPLRPGLVLVGSSLEHANDVATQLEALAEPVRIDRIPTLVGVDTGKNPPSISFGSKVYTLGEIGLSYLAYHLRGSNAAYLGSYRGRDWPTLQAMINNDFGEYRKTEDLNVVCTSIDNELLGIMKHYTSVKHREILRTIDLYSIKAWVRYWRWYPTQMEIWLSSPAARSMRPHSFISGVKVTNGESGHRALLFEASLWTEGLDYEFTRPVLDKGYARHLHPLKLERVVSNLKEVLGEHKLMVAFDALSIGNGVAAAEIVEAVVNEAKESPSKEKLMLALEDGLSVPAAMNGLEVFYATTEIARKTNKLSMKIAQKACDALLAWAGADE